MTAVATQKNHGDKHGLRPQPHGGALRNGGTNRGGPGRLPDRIKRVAQKALLPRIQLLAHFADGVAVQQGEDANGNRVFELASPTPAERIKAIAELNKIGMGAQVNVPNLRRRLRAQIRVIRETLPAEQADALLSALSEVWR